MNSQDISELVRKTLDYLEKNTAIRKIQDAISHGTLRQQYEAAVSEPDQPTIVEKP